MLNKKNIPASLIILRVLLIPVILFIAYQFPNKKYLIGIACCISIVADFFDGYIARRLHIATKRLRIWDSYVDLLFWLATAWCAWLCFPLLIKEHSILVIILLVLEFLPDAVYVFKFKKLGCAHSYLSKGFALLLFILFLILFFNENAGVYFLIVILIGFIAEIDRLLIAFILTERKCDVPSFYHAILIRKGISFKRNKLFHSDVENC